MDFRQHSAMIDAAVRVMELAESDARHEFPSDDPVIVREAIKRAFLILCKQGQAVTPPALLSKYRELRLAAYSAN